MPGVLFPRIFVDIDKALGELRIECFPLFIGQPLVLVDGPSEQLWEQELEKAAEIQRRLRELAQQIGESVYWQLGPGSRISGGTPEAIFGMVRRTDQTLAAIGIDANRIEKLKCPWHKCVMHDLARPIRKAFGDILLRKAEGRRAKRAP